MSFTNKVKIGVKRWGSISCLGAEEDRITQNWNSPCHNLSWDEKLKSWVSKLDEETEKLIKELQQENKYYAKIDRCVLLAILAARKAIKNCGWSASADIGLNLGSSRGTTGLLEKNIISFHSTGETPLLSSPLTSAGNISSWVAHDLGIRTIAFDHSVTCSSATYALANGLAWLYSGLTSKMLVGGVEAPLTPFTIAQMRKLGIYTNASPSWPYPCQPLSQAKQNSFVLGEGCAIFGLEKMNPAANYLATIQSIGFAQEPITTPTGITPNAQALQLACQKALAQAHLSPDKIDLILTHAPGTFAGDSAEINGLKHIFGDNLPYCYSPKWKIGHLLGASSALSIELALLILNQKVKIEPLPYPTFQKEKKPPLVAQHILVNSLGFGGNAMCIILSKSEKN
jgi:3-oxoacyl-(acyl-carrier-protein) synthase